MADENFFLAGDFPSGLGAAPFFAGGSGDYAPGLDVAACAAAMAAPAAFGVLPWGDMQLPADSAATITAAHFDSALSSLVSSPAHGSASASGCGGVGDDVAIGNLIGRLGSICNAAASANNSCYSTPLNSPPRGASPALVFRGCYPGAPPLESGRLSRVASSKSLGGAPALENAEGETSPAMARNTGTPDPAPAKGAGASRKRKASAKGKASSPATTAATNGMWSPKRSKVAADGGENDNDDAAVATAAAEEKAAAAPEPPKDYIHVRARRGQATDSHSLAERVRREKISERMKLLQSLVPGCNKITGKALMLDEIINYVQSLQRQVEFLSMKLATMNPQLELDEQYLPSDKDMMQHQTAATAMLAYPHDAALSYADPFAAMQPPPPTESCTSSLLSVHPGGGFAGWEAQDLQSIVRHNMAACSHDQKHPTSPTPQPHHGFHGEPQQQQAATVSTHMKVEP